MQFPANLAVPAHEQNLDQSNTSADFNRTPSLSFAESIGSVTIGHLTSRSGSFHTIQRSCCQGALQLPANLTISAEQ